MSDINCIPDKNGVPFCNKDEECPRIISGECEGIWDGMCYLKMVRIVAALQRFADIAEIHGDHALSILRDDGKKVRLKRELWNEATEALSHE